MEEEQCRILQEKIKETMHKIVVIKNEILEMYDSDHLNSIIPNYKKRASLFHREDVGDFYKTDALKCCFYQTFMTVHKKNNSNVVVAFPTKEKEVYGLELQVIKDETFSIEKQNLPFSITPEKILTNISHIRTVELAGAIGLCCKCVYVYLDRKAQTNKLKEFKNKIGQISISSCRQVVRIMYLAESARTNQETYVTVILKYGDLSFRPTSVRTCFDVNVLSKKEKFNLLRKTEVFAIYELLDAYKKFFKME